MGRVVKITSFQRRSPTNRNVDEVTGDPGTGNNLTCDYFTVSGDDSPPLNDDIAITTENPRVGGESVVGVMDIKNQGVAQQGEKRIYSRNDNGEVVATIHLKNDSTIDISNDNCRVLLSENGSVQLFNSSGGVELTSSGDFKIGVITISQTGEITGVTTVNGITPNHTHTSMSPGSPTGPPINM